MCIKLKKTNTQKYTFILKMNSQYSVRLNGRMLICQWQSIDCQLTVNWLSIDSQLTINDIIDNQLTINWQSIDSQWQP